MEKTFILFAIYKNTYKLNKRTSLPCIHFMLAHLEQKFLQSQTLSRKNLLKRLLYEKCMRKMLMKLILEGENLNYRDFLFKFFFFRVVWFRFQSRQRLKSKKGRGYFFCKNCRIVLIVKFSHLQSVSWIWAS